MNLYGYSLSLTVIEYQIAVLRGDMEAAAEILSTTPKDQMNKIVCFLEGRGLFTLAGNSMTLITKFLDLKELALFDTALGIVCVVPEHAADVKWKSLGDPCGVEIRFGEGMLRECWRSKRTDIMLCFSPQVTDKD
jgi:coatomer subunit beta'